MVLQEQPHARYVDSFKRQFADQYVQLLRQQTTQKLGNALPECLCLIGVAQGSQQVLATCDVRPPEDAAGLHPDGVPLHDKTAAYVTNVAVDANSRGQGLGFQMLEAAATFALEHWQAEALYTTVDPENKVARHARVCMHASCLYSCCSDSAHQVLCTITGCLHLEPVRSHG